MPLRPGHQINVKSSPPSRSVSTDTGVLFLTGMSEKGDPTVPIKLASMSDYATLLGQRVSYGIAYDVLETFFREGGTTAYFARVLGPNPVKATLTLKDASTTNTVVVTAKSAGAWGNAVKVGVVAGTLGGTIDIQVTDLVGNVLEQSYDLTTKADVLAWGAVSTYVNIADSGTGGVPVAVAPATMTGAATGDETNATETQWTAALTIFGGSLGCGQVAAPGRTTAASALALAAHAAANNRFAVIDLADTATVSTLTAAALAIRAGGNGRFASAFAPWVTVPPLAGSTTPRIVPPSALVAGLIARSDASSDADTAPAGDNGQALFALGADFTYTDAQRDTLNTAGVCVIRQMLGGVRLYGIRTLTDPVADPNWIQFPQYRFIMQVEALGNNILEDHMFNKIDGKGIEFARLGGDLTGMLGRFYPNSLFGDTPTQAYSVNVGGSVNTPVTIAAGEIHAQLSLRVNPTGELIVLDLVKVPTNQNL